MTGVQTCALPICVGLCEDVWGCVGMCGDVFQHTYHRCCARAFSNCGERGLLFVVVHGLLIVVASLVAEHGL